MRIPKIRKFFGGNEQFLRYGQESFSFEDSSHLRVPFLDRLDPGYFSHALEHVRYHSTKFDENPRTLILDPHKSWGQKPDSLRSFWNLAGTQKMISKIRQNLPGSDRTSRTPAITITRCHFSKEAKKAQKTLDLWIITRKLLVSAKNPPDFRNPR